MDRKPAPPKVRWIALYIAQFLALIMGAQASRTVEAVEAKLESDAAADLAGSPEFQVTVEIVELVDGKSYPIDRHLIIFKNDQAYDFSLVQPMDVTVIDWKAEQMVVLSRQKSLQSSLPIANVQQSAAQVRVYAKKNDLESHLGIDAVAKRSADGTIELSFDDYHYAATGNTVQSPSLAARFAQFTLATARLNLARHRGAPPFARMSLAKELAAKGELPQTVQLQIESDGKTRTLVSHYTVKEKLSPEAEDRVRKVTEMMTLYRDVPMADMP
ncbi:hypothetical protein LOC67_08545 [Stieleria sp. JC731]|uniref:hypothetical protein n=1 Tax=Pirellulaceae TaxID=2691357 RepID=UPI001E610984|nr:hypothetical protein [Stieleria sp. JC731]MCC9600608.1 hypothetical protein [Stieleria sp. JC731]